MICPYCFSEGAWQLHREKKHPAHCWGCIKECKACLSEIVPAYTLAPLLVSLSEEEAEEAIKSQIERKKKRGRVKGKAWQGVGKLDSNEVLGCKGESVVRKAFELNPKPTVLSRPDGGFGDVRLPGKLGTASVKTKSYWYRNNNNYFHYQDPLTLLDDFGVLVSPPRDVENVDPYKQLDFMILGYITKENYHKKKWTGRKEKYGTSNGVTAEKDMSDIRELIEMSRAERARSRDG